MVKPIENGHISQTFEQHKARQKGSWGIDIGSTSNEPVNVHCAITGIAHTVGWSDTFGYRVWVKMLEGEHKGYYAIYPHLSKINDNIKVGQVIKEGDVIGEMGNTGTISINGKLTINKYVNGKLIYPMPLARHLHYEHRTKPDTTGLSLKPREIESLYLD